MENIISMSGGDAKPPGKQMTKWTGKAVLSTWGTGRHTFGILDEDLADVVHFSQAGTPALLGLLGSL